MNDEKIDFDFEKQALEIRTDSKMKSEEQVILNMYTVTSHLKGTLGISFTMAEEIENGYSFSACRSHVPFNVKIPSDVDKVWRVTMQIDTDVHFEIHCNDLEVARGKFSEICVGDYESSWLGSQVKKIGFPGRDTASDYYRVFQGNSFFFIINSITKYIKI